MGIRKILLSCAALAVIAGSASAMDHKGWYVGLGGGYSKINEVDEPGTNNDMLFDGGYGVYGSLGYAFGKHWRVEAELGYRVNDMQVKRGTTTVVLVPGELSEVTGMLNVAYDIKLWDRTFLSLMTGIGNDIPKEKFDTPFRDDSDSVFAYQLGAELGYQATPHLDLYVGYRYLNATHVEYSGAKTLLGFDQFMDYKKHLIGVGLRYGYDAPEPPAPVAPPPPPPPPAIKQFIVFFGFNKYNLTSEAQAVVAEAASAAKSQGAASIIVVGHTDTVGGNAYNQRLSEKRAGAVKDELVRLGIDAGKITASGKGETELLVQTGDSVKEPQNRRATIDLK